MNILHISRTMGQGGAEKVVFQLCNSCKENTPFVVSCGGEYVSELEKRGIIHIQIPDIDKKNPLLIIKTLSILMKTVKRYKINIIHSHHRMAAFYTRIIQIFNPNIFHVYTSHNVFHGKKRLLRFALKKAKIIACGETVKHNLVNEYGIEAESIEVICNSIEFTGIKEMQIDDIDIRTDNGFYLIGSIGRITVQKGFDVFVKAISVARLSNPKIVGVIIGDGEDRESIRDLVTNEKLEDAIVFLGYQKDVLSIINKMEFIVLASRWEGFPLTPIETFSVGKTIIVSDIPNNTEIVDDEINGLVFHKNDYNDLASKILSLANNSELKNELEENAKKKYLSKYDFRLFIENYSNVYREFDYKD